MVSDASELVASEAIALAEADEGMLAEADDAAEVAEEAFSDDEVADDEVADEVAAVGAEEMLVADGAEACCDEGDAALSEEAMAAELDD